MQGWVAASVAVGSWRAYPGGHVSDMSIVPSAAVSHPPSVPLQSNGGVGGMILAGALVLLLGLVAVAVLQRRSGRSVGGTDTSVETTEATGGSGGAAASGGATAESPTTESATSESGAAELTDRETIVEILEDNDGRMKQARIVDATGWSKSKVSMLLSEMEDEGEVTKLRVGRENIVSLRGNEPDAAGSPFDSG